MEYEPILLNGMEPLKRAIKGISIAIQETRRNVLDYVLTLSDCEVEALWDYLDDQQVLEPHNTNRRLMPELSLYGLTIIKGDSMRLIRKEDYHG